MRKRLLESVQARMGKQFKVRCVARFTVEDALEKRVPSTSIHTDVLVLKDSRQHCVLWVGKTWRMPTSVYDMLSKAHPLGRFIRDNLPDALSWRFYCYDAGHITYEARYCIIHAAKPPLNGYAELPARYKTSGYLAALMERQLKRGQANISTGIGER